MLPAAAKGCSRGNRLQAGTSPPGSIAPGNSAHGKAGGAGGPRHQCQPRMQARLEGTCDANQAAPLGVSGTARCHRLSGIGHVFPPISPETEVGAAAAVSPCGSSSSRSKVPVSMARVGKLDVSSATPRQPGARRRFIEPCHPSERDEPPLGIGWVHEIKMDGFRVQVHLADGRAIVYSRRGHDWSEEFSAIARAAESLPVRDAVLDGEGIVQDRMGFADFNAPARDRTQACRSNQLLRIRPLILKW